MKETVIPSIIKIWTNASGRACLPGRLRAWLAGVMLVLLAGSAPCRADLVLSVTNVQWTSATEGTFEVVLENEGSSQIDVAGFSLEVTVPDGSMVNFADVTSATVSAPYLFDGTGTATVDPGFVFATIDSPPTRFTAADTEWTFPSIGVGAGDVFGLAFVSFLVLPAAPAGTVPIHLVAGGTSVSDADGNPIAFEARDGELHVSGISVPEPSTAAAALVVLAIGALSKGYRLRAHSQTN